MGNSLSDNITQWISSSSSIPFDSQNAVNYNCKVCMKKGELPNINGRFIILDWNPNVCECTGCHNRFRTQDYFFDVFHEN